MRPLFITSAYPSSPDDPRGSFIRDLAVGLATRGVSPIVVAPGHPSAPERSFEDGVAVHRVPYARDPARQRLAVGLGGIVPNLRRRPWLVLSIPRLIAALRQAAESLAKDCDLVHAHWLYPGGVVGVNAALAAGRPLIVTSHGGDVNLARRFPPLAWWSRRVLDRSDALLGVSHAMVDGLIALDAPRDRVRFLPLGVDVSTTCDPRELPSSFSQFAATKSLRVLFAGGLSHRKSPSTLLDAARRLRQKGVPIAVAILGEGPLRRQLEQRIVDDRLANTWVVGPRPPREVATWMRSSDVLVLPSRSEGRGLVIVEAMACARAVIATGIPGPDELVTNGETGFLFPPGDGEALADCLSRLARDPSLASRLGAAGRAIVERDGLLLDDSVTRHLQLYEEVCTRPRRTP